MAGPRKAQRPSWQPRYDHLDVVDALLSSGRCKDLDTTDAKGRTALYWAAESGHAPVVCRLLEARAKTTAMSNGDITMLMAASSGGHPGVVKALLSTGKSIDLEDVDWLGQTALFMVAGNCHVDVVRHLLEADADAGTRDNDEATPLMAASTGGHLEVVGVLLASGRCGGLDDRDENGRTAVYLADSNGHFPVVRCLLEIGADCGAVASDGMSAPGAASFDGHDGCCASAGVAGKTRRPRGQGQRGPDGAAPRGRAWSRDGNASSAGGRRRLRCHGRRRLSGPFSRRHIDPPCHLVGDQRQTTSLTGKLSVARRRTAAPRDVAFGLCARRVALHF